MGWEPGTAVLWRSVKDGVVDVATPCRVVRDEDDLVALYLCPGTRGRRRKGHRGGSGRQILPDGGTRDYEDYVSVTQRSRGGLALTRFGKGQGFGGY